MFGIDGFEFLIILIIMIVVVGPKDLPKMVRAFGQATAKMRKTAMEFRRHFDEAMREAELGDLSDTLHEMKKLDPRKNLTEIFDPIREVTSDIKASLAEPVAPSSAPPTPLTHAVPTATAVEKQEDQSSLKQKRGIDLSQKNMTKQDTQAVKRAGQSKKRSKTKKSESKKAVEAP